MPAARCTVLAAVISLLPMTAHRAGTQPDAPAALYKPQAGPAKVESIRSLSLHDAARGKDLVVRITYPAGDQSVPLVIFSHGMFGSKDGYAPLVEHWVSHGYIVIQPTYGDSVSLGNRFGDFAGGSRHWDSRPADVSVILDSLDAIEKQVPRIAGRIDRRRIGMGGHSFGAHTTMLIAGVAPRKAGGRASFADDRVTAAVVISPQGKGAMLDEQSFAAMSKPALFITGTHDQSPNNDQPYTWRLAAYEHAPAGDKLLLVLAGARHDFGGISGARYPGRGPDRPHEVALVLAATLAWWDAHLKADAQAGAYLGSDVLGKHPGLERYGAK